MWPPIIPISAFQCDIIRMYRPYALRNKRHRNLCNFNVMQQRRKILMQQRRKILIDMVFDKRSELTNAPCNMHHKCIIKPTIQR